MVILTKFRKTEISELAEAFANFYFPNSLILPEVLAKEHNVTFSYGNYEDYFDGLLQHSGGQFHIFINLDRLSNANTPRARFTFGHELGHYFIDEHRNALRKGKAPSHPSFNKIVAKNLVEREADYFSSCFLAPSKRFKALCLKRPLDPKLIEDLSKSFEISTSACLFRYLDLNLSPMILIFSTKGIIQWTMPTWDFKFTWPEKGGVVKGSTVAGEFFSTGKRYLDKEIIFADDWFKNVGRNSQQLYEKCYYLSEESVLSMVWCKER